MKNWKWINLDKYYTCVFLIQREKLILYQCWHYFYPNYVLKSSRKNWISSNFYLPFDTFFFRKLAFFFDIHTIGKWCRLPSINCWKRKSVETTVSFLTGRLDEGSISTPKIQVFRFYKISTRLKPVVLFMIEWFSSKMFLAV